MSIEDNVPKVGGDTPTKGSKELPLAEYIGVSSLNKDIINSSSPNVWTGGGDVNLSPQQFANQSSSESQYRKNRVINTLGGHEIHFNDAENKLVVIHSQGGGIEYHADGSLTFSSPGAREDFVGKEYTLHVDADGALTFKGNLKLNVGGDLDIDCVNFNVNASGNKTETIGGSHRKTVTGNFGEQVAGGYSTTVAGQTTNTHLGGYSANIKGTFSNNVNGDANFFSSGYTYMTAETDMNLATDNMTISSQDMTVQSDTGTIGGENMQMYTMNMRAGGTVYANVSVDTPKGNITRVAGTSAHYTTFHGSLNGTALRSITADVTNSQNYSDPDTHDGSAGNTGAAQGFTISNQTADDLANNTTETAKPTKDMMTEWLGKSTGGIRRVKIDEDEIIRKHLLKNLINGGISDKTLSPDQVRSKLRDASNLNNVDFITSALENNSLNPSYFEKIPENIGRVVNQGDPRLITTLNPTVLSYNSKLPSTKAVNIIPDNKFNPDTVDKQFINSRLKFAPGISMAKFLATDDPTNMNWMRNIEDRTDLARYYYLHSQLIQIIKNDKDQFKDFRLTISEGLYRPGPNETVTANSINDLKKKGKAVVYRLIDQTGNTALAKTFDLATLWGKTQNFEKLILSYDTIDMLKDLEARIIVILPELKVSSSTGENSSSVWSANFNRKIETQYNNSVIAENEFVEVLTEGVDPATNLAKGNRAWKKTTHRFLSNQNVNPPQIGYDGTRGKIDPSQLVKVQDLPVNGEGTGPVLLSKTAAFRFNKLKNAAAVAGFDIKLNAGYKSFYYQSREFSDVSFSSVPAATVSRTGLGEAIKIADCTYKSPLWNWVKANGHKPENGGWFQDDTTYFQTVDPFHWSDTGK